MNLKLFLTAGVALAAMGAGSASALVTSASISGDEIAAPVAFASEVVLTGNDADLTDRDNGLATVAFGVASGTFPSGNLLLDVTLSNATFEGVMNGGAFDFTGCTGGAVNSVVSSGGADGSTTVTYVVSNLDNCSPGDSGLISVPFDVTSHGAVNVTVGIRTEGNAPIDGGPSVIPLVTSASAFSVAIAASASPVADVLASGGAYRDFTGVGAETLGTVAVVADTDVFVNLGGVGSAVAADETDVSAVNVTVTGNYNGFVVADGGAVTLDGQAAVIAGTLASFTPATGDFVANDVADPGAFIVTPDLDNAIQSSDYSASVSVDLSAAFTDPSTVVGSFGSITRNGSFAVLPWTQSGTQSRNQGRTDFIRVSNPTGEPFGAVRATVLSSTFPGAVGDTATIAPSVAAGGSLVVTGSTLQTALGNYGTADVEISVEGTGAIIRRIVNRPDGQYEINNELNNNN